MDRWILNIWKTPTKAKRTPGIRKACKIAGRPKKDTVDYFPHFVNAGKTLSIIEHRFGLKGYAGYYKLLELLAESHGHFYEYKKAENIYYALAKTGLDEKQFLEMMKLLVALEEADMDIWEREKYIWLPRFVETLKPVYDKRNNDLPTPPGSTLKPISGTETPISGTEIHKGKERKGKERKEKEGNIDHPPIHKSNIPSWALAYKDTYPQLNIETSWKKYRLYKSDKGQSITKEGFEFWVERDIENGWNVIKGSGPKTSTLYCEHLPMEHPVKEVPKENAYGHICSVCENTMVFKYEIEHNKGLIKKRERENQNAKRKAINSE